MSDSPPITDDYDDLNVHEVESLVGDIDDPADLDALVIYEAQHKDRKMVTEAIDDRRDELDDDDAGEGEAEAEADADATAADADAPIDAETQPIDADDQSSHPTENTHSRPTDRFERVRVTPGPGSTGGHIAGHTFGANEVKEIPATADVKNALMKGILQNVA